MEQIGNVKVLFIAGFGPIVRGLRGRPFQIPQAALAPLAERCVVIEDSQVKGVTSESQCAKRAFGSARWGRSTILR